MPIAAQGTAYKTPPARRSVYHTLLHPDGSRTFFSRHPGDGRLCPVGGVLRPHLAAQRLARLLAEGHTVVEIEVLAVGA